MNLKEKTVVIDDKIYQHSKIVMLNSDIQTDLCFRNYLFKNKDNIGAYSNVQFKHLYFLSTDEICEGDIGYISVGKDGTIGTISYDKEYKTWDLTTKDGIHYPFSSKKYIKKVISSTDPSLNLPKPSNSFLQVYIDAYNKGEKIEECLIEYDYIVTNEDFSQTPVLISGYTELKVTKGEITIRKVKESWSREEVIALLTRSHSLGGMAKIRSWGLTNWISQNL